VFLFLGELGDLCGLRLGLEKEDQAMLEDWKRVLVFGAHVDDEVIGPGGTIARLSDLGAEITVVTFTGGNADTGYARLEWKDKMGEMRREEARGIDAALGIGRRIFLGLPTQDVRNEGTVFRECVRIIRQARPDVIFTHWVEDKHRDHRVAALIVDEARWKASEPIMNDLGPAWHTPELYFYEILELFPHPSILVDISPTLERKLSAMQAAETQLDVLPGIVNYIKGIGMARGYSRGVPYAEAFLRSNLLPTFL
jgi:LmbE family N-acetylglucosaminyl deacetylase